MGYQKAEIHFYEQEKCAVFLESDVTEGAEMIELQLVALFTVRMLSNFGVNETTDKLAEFLLAAPRFVPEFASGAVKGSLSLVSYQGHSGRYSFETSVTGQGPQARFIFTPKGFGWFGKGLGYYGPMAVQALIRKLAEARSNDDLFLKLLRKSVANCGVFHLQRKISVSNHGEVASYAIHDAAFGSD